MAQKAQAEFAKSWICVPYYPWLSMAKINFTAVQAYTYF